MTHSQGIWKFLGHTLYTSYRLHYEYMKLTYIELFRQRQYCLFKLVMALQGLEEIFTS